MEFVKIFSVICIGLFFSEGIASIIRFYRSYVAFTATETKTFFHPIRGEYTLSRYVPYRYYYKKNVWKRKKTQLFVEKRFLTKKAELIRKDVWETIPFEQSKHFHALIRQNPEQ